MMGDNVGDLRGVGYKLDVFLPIDLYIVDLGGGIRETPRQQEAEAFSDRFRAPFVALDRNVAQEDSSVRRASHGRERLVFYYDAPCHDEPRDRKHFS